jgi:hypothetical protein
MQQPADGNGSPATSPRHYVWTIQGKPISIRLAYDVVDRLHVEVMQGFGAVPKRGAEVGGLLLGKATQDEALDVVIDDYQGVPCEHRHGPSFLLSENDRREFAAAVEKWRRKDGSARYVVGYYRSNTRPEFSLSDDDLALWQTFLPEPSTVVLLIRPFASKASQAGFFFREDGAIRMETPDGIFPFRRQDLGGGMTPKPGAAPAAPPPTAEPETEAPAESGPERRQRLFPVANREEATPAAASLRTLSRFAVASPGPSDIEERPAKPAASAAPVLSPLEALAPRRAKRRAPIPFAFVFLTLGVLLGFQAALQLRQAPQAVPIEETVRLGLQVTQRGDNIQLNWNRNGPAFQAAQHAVLQIWDGETRQTADLDAATLRGGNVVYRGITRTVRFRMEVYMPGGGTVSETAEWRAP